MKKLFLLITVLSGALLIMSMRLADNKPYEIGDKVENFKLKNVDETWVSLDEYMGDQGAIIIFTCNTCPYAQLYEDRIIDLHSKFSEKGFPVLAVNPNDAAQKPGDSFEKMQARSNEKEFPFPYVFDADQKVYPKFGATNTPHVFLIDADMQLRYIGAIDDNAQNPEAVKTKYVEDAIDALMTGKDPVPARTKAIGCGIKAKKSMG
ncbi:MAG: thioredoxin family protein [Saprospiraceae bacterium]|nr:thioredoxin family protein [Saprospiraceae bacterium]